MTDCPNHPNYGDNGQRKPRAPPALPHGYTYTSCYCEENVYLLAETFAAQLSGRWDVFVVFVSNPSKTVALWNQRAGRDDSGLVIWDYHVVLILRATRVKQEGPRPTDSISASQTSQPPASSRPRDNDSGESPGVSSVCSPADGLGGTCTDSWVYDFDTRLPTPCRYDEYVRGTFPYAPVLPEYDLDGHYVSMFRIIPADVYLDRFVSDRSHMLVPPSVAIEQLEDASDHSREDPVSYTFSAEPPSYPPLRGRKVTPGCAIRTNLMSRFVSMKQTPTSTRREDRSRAPAVLHRGHVLGKGTRDIETLVYREVVTAEDEIEGDDASYGKVVDMSGFLRWNRT